MKGLLPIVGGMLMIGCETGSISKQLAEVDSLVYKEEYDSAYQMISSLDATAIKNQEDVAHYNLLKVQTGYLVDKPIESSDSLLNKAIVYYQKKNDAEKLADGFYYKAITAYNQKEYQKSISFYKEAELHSKQSDNLRQQYKIAEGISFVNGICANYDLQLYYSKMALGFATQVNNKKWIPFSYYRLGIAYLDCGKKDSALYYYNKIQPLLQYVSKKDLPIMLSSIGHLLKFSHPQEAKKYLLQSIEYKEFTATYTDLADISYDEGNYKDDYLYLKKALAVQDATPKHNIIRNLIEYDLERGKTDSISDMVTQIFEIRDSIDAKLKDDTIKDLQTRFDHELALKEKDRIFVRGILIMTVVIFVLIGVFSAVYFRRRHLAKLQMLDYQMQINDNLRQIEILQASGTDTKQEVERLNKLIEDIMQNKAPKLDRGRMLYDDIMNGNITMIDWNREHEQMFLDYYTATHYDTVKKMKNVRRVGKLTPHKLFYLILVKLGKTDEQIQQMMSISDSTLRGLKHRTKPLS